MKEFKIGDMVWWFDAWDTLRWGVIYELKTGYALIHEEGRKGVETGAKLSRCHQSKQECLDASKRRIDATKQAYMDEIKDVKDLVRFLFDHDTHSEFRDYEAIEVAKIKAKELLDMDLED